MRLFISYAHADDAAVRAIIDLLRAGGHAPWFDAWLQPGQDWQAALLEGIQGCDAFVYMLSPRAVKSPWCQWEFGKAVQMGKAVIPVLLDAATELPAVLSHIQYVDFSAPPGDPRYARATAQLMGGLTRVAVIVAQADLPPLPDPHGFATHSNLVRTVDYDPGTRILTVGFPKNALYQYEDVPPEVYRDLAAAKSRGGYFNKHVRPVYRFRRVR